MPLALGLAPRPGLAALATAAVLALVVVPVALKSGGSGTPQGDRVVNIQVMPAGDGAVRLAWSDGTKGSYTIYKSTDPRRQGAVEVHRVSGNVWIDRDASAAPVVYYRIE